MKNEAPTELSLDELDAVDEAHMTVVVNGKETTWVWTFAGPGHPQTVDQADRLSRERLHQDRLKEQAQVNGRKWKAPEESVDEVRGRNIAWVVERLIGWSPVKIGGEMVPFSAEAATKLLSDPRKGALLTQAMEFLAAETSFTKPSA
jgi:hypothetical protein